MKTIIMSREREVGRVRRALGRLHSLRLQMMLIVALTGATGFLSPVLLLSGGVHSMPLRYPLVAVLVTAAGAAMHAYAPQAKSIGQVIKQMKAD
jgi:hypothetical protein